MEELNFVELEGLALDGIDFQEAVVAQAEELLADTERLDKMGVQIADVERVRMFTNFLYKIFARDASDGLDEFRFRINQLRALKDFMDFLRNAGEGNNMGYFRQPTGAGKTILMGSLLRLLDDKSLILVPNLVLLDQTKRSLINHFGYSEDDIGIVGGGSTEEDRKITICTYQSLGKIENNGFKVVLCDEVHRALGKMTQERLGEIAFDADDEDADGIDENTERMVGEVIDRKRFAAAVVLGFTATPKLRNKVVGDYLGKEISSSTFRELIEAGFLKRIELLHTKGNVYEEDMGGRTYLSPEEEEVINEREHAYEKLHALYMRLREEKQGLKTAVYCPTIEGARKYKAIAKADGLRVAIYTSKDKDMEINEIEEGLRTGEIDMVINVGKLEEGWDFVDLNCVILARASLSPRKILQPMGRGMRRVEGGDEVLYLLETNWQLMNKSDSRYGEGGEEEQTTEEGVEEQEIRPREEKENGVKVGGVKPLTVAESLLLEGDLEGVVSIYGGGSVEIVDRNELWKERIIELVKAKVEGETDEEKALVWIGMTLVEKNAFGIGIGEKKMKLGAIAGALGEACLNPASNPDDFKILGIVLFGENIIKKAIELYKERIIEAVKAKVEGETDVEKAFVWVGMTKVEKNAFEIKIGGKNMKLGAIAGALGEAGLNPTSNSADFKRLGIKIFGDHDCFN